MAMIQITTPDRLVSPQKQPISITEAQKQALIENLQLEGVLLYLDIQSLATDLRK